MTTASPTGPSLLAENAELRARLVETEEMLRAIRSGEADALIVQTPSGPQVFTLQGVDAESNRFRGEILAQVTDAVMAVDADHRITYFNPAAERQYDFTSSEVLGRRLDEVYQDRWLHPGDQAAAMAALDERGEWRGESIHVLRSGRLQHVESILTILRENKQDAAPGGMLAVIRDIADRKQAEKAVHLSEERFRAIADSIPQLAWMADSQGRLDWFNRGWLEYTGTTLQDNLGSGWKSVHHPDHLQKVAEKLERALRDGTDWEDTFPLLGKDGRYRWFLSRMNAIRDLGTGRIVRFFGTNTDVTERFMLEDQVSRQAAMLAEESRRKDEFLAMLSHELRNPLAPIRAAAHMMKLQDKGGNEVQTQAREIIERQVANLTRIVSDLLEVSRVLSGGIRLELKPVDLRQVVAHAAQTVAPHIEQRGHTLAMHPCAEGLWVNGDEVRLEEVLINLLDNAVKYTPNGGTIDAYCEQDAAYARVRVRDNGMGIDAELLPRIFKLFTQGSRSLARSEGGLGIGLSLAHRLIGMHGGTIETKSDGPGRGAEFVVNLPLMPPPQS